MLYNKKKIMANNAIKKTIGVSFGILSKLWGVSRKFSATKMFL